MLWDTHLHTNFSGDSESSPISMIEAGITKGLLGLCFTDHMDLDYPKLDEIDFTFSIPEYLDTFSSLSKHYQDKISILTGVEIGLQPHLVEQYKKLTTKNPFDFVIGSSHLVHGLDPFYPAFFEGRDEHLCYLEYFESILENLDHSFDFDVYGHLDYVVRYGPSTNKNYSYTQYKEIIDEILKKLIAHGKGIELNMAGFKYGLNHPNPTEAILKRYKELHGEIITIGSDAHKPEYIAFHFHKISTLLQNAGFSYYTVFKSRKEEFYPLG